MLYDITYYCIQRGGTYVEVMFCIYTKNVIVSGLHDNRILIVKITYTKLHFLTFCNQKYKSQLRPGN